MPEATTIPQLRRQGLDCRTGGGLTDGWGLERCRPSGLASGWGLERCRPEVCSWRSGGDERTGKSAASNRRKYGQTPRCLPCRTLTDRRPPIGLPVWTLSDRRPPIRLAMPEGLERQTRRFSSIRTLPDRQTPRLALVRTRGLCLPARVYVKMTLPPLRALTSTPVASSVGSAGAKP